MNKHDQLRCILAEPLSINQRESDSELKAALKIILMDCENEQEVTSEPHRFAAVVEFVADGFGHIDPRELPIVFDLALMGKIELPHAFAPKFGKRYFGAVLAAYEPKRRQLAKTTREQVYQGKTFPKPKETLRIG